MPVKAVKYIVVGDASSGQARRIAGVVETDDKTEIAFQIGYQSLSQFNRSFARFTGNSPTNFRREELARAASV
jgi:AraC-like DNA-binding protein